MWNFVLIHFFWSHHGALKDNDKTSFYSMVEGAKLEALKKFRKWFKLKFHSNSSATKIK